MKYLRGLGVLTIFGMLFLIPASTHAQGLYFGAGVEPGYYGAPPNCLYGYYSYYPYSCVPYGYYGPEWLNDGIFIGAGPWYGWGWAVAIGAVEVSTVAADFTAVEDTAMVDAVG